MNCAFLWHEDSGPNSPHNVCVKCYDDLIAQSHHINKVFHKQSAEFIVNNHLLLNTSLMQFFGLHFQHVHLEVMMKVFNF